VPRRRCAFDVAIIERTALSPIPRTNDSFVELPEQVTSPVRERVDPVSAMSAASAASAPHNVRTLREVLSCKNVFKELTMNGDDRRRRVVAAQGLAALALFLFAHGAHAATPPMHANQGAGAPAAAVQARP
jgi:hypothetical protein